MQVAIGGESNSFGYFWPTIRALTIRALTSRAGASAIASLACVPTWHEDFREDLARIDVPTQVIHGDADRILPITAAGLRTAKLIKGVGKLVVGEPIVLTWLLLVLLLASVDIYGLLAYMVGQRHVRPP